MQLPRAVIVSAIDGIRELMSDIGSRSRRDLVSVWALNCVSIQAYLCDSQNIQQAGETPSPEQLMVCISHDRSSTNNCLARGFARMRAQMVLNRAVLQK